MSHLARLFPRAAACAALSFLLLSALPASAQFGTNLLVNPGAESNAGGSGGPIGVVTGWAITGQFTGISYATGNGYPDATTPGPADRGTNFFGGGNVTSSSGTQVVDLSSFAAAVDTGSVGFGVEAWLGGFASQDDNAQLTVNFRNASNSTLSTAILGTVLATDRGSITSFLLRSTGGSVPVGARNAQVILQMTRSEGSSNDGYADNLSLTLSAPIVVPEAGTLALLGFALVPVGVGLVRRRK